MKTIKKIMSYALSVFFVLIAGCSDTSWFGGGSAGQGASGTEIKVSGNQQERRFNETSSDTPTVVESAMDLSKKYAVLTDQTVTIKQDNHQLAAENRSLKERVTFLEAELKQARKELAEANGLIVDTRVELNNWKNNILGFRDEIRQADSEQIKALLEILKILGGEIKPDPNQGSTRTRDLVSR